MEILLKDPYGISSYDSNGGYFVALHTDNSIFRMKTCREDFAHARAEANFHNRIGFKKSRLNLKLINNFWNEVFKMLGEKSRFEIHTSNFIDLIVIDMPEFWNKNDTLQSIFTLFLRCSVVFYAEGDTVLAAFKKYSLAMCAFPAIEWFLKGNTVPTYEKLTRMGSWSSIGFIAEFCGLTQEQIKTKLIK